MKLVLGGTRQADLRTAHQILKVYTEALTEFKHIYRRTSLGFSHACHQHGLSSTFLAQGLDLGAASGKRKGKWNAHSKDRGVGEEPPGAGVQHEGQ